MNALKPEYEKKGSILLNELYYIKINNVCTKRKNGV